MASEINAKKRLEPHNQSILAFSRIRFATVPLPTNDLYNNDERCSAIELLAPKIHSLPQMSLGEPKQIRTVIIFCVLSLKAI